MQPKQALFKSSTMAVITTKFDDQSGSQPLSSPKARKYSSWTAEFSCYDDTDREQCNCDFYGRDDLHEPEIPVAVCPRLPMNQAQVDHRYQDMEKLLWQLDVLLAREIHLQLFSDFFKDTTYRSSILYLYETLRMVVQRFVKRESGIEPEWHIRFVSRPDLQIGVTASTTYIMDCDLDFEVVEISLHPLYWQLQSGVQNYRNLDAQSSTLGDWAAAVQNRIHTLGHELFHAVSHLVWGTLTRNLGRKALLMKLTGGRSIINDVKISTAAVADDPKDSEIVRAVLARGPEIHSSYGIRNCRFLAQLKNGALASFMNADSYSWVLQINTYGYLRGKMSLTGGLQFNVVNPELNGLFDLWIDGNKKRQAILAGPSGNTVEPVEPQQRKDGKQKPRAPPPVIRNPTQ
jgi:hypothetical protein